MAAAASISLTHLALVWNGEHPAVTSTLLGPRTEDQLADLLGAAGIRLDPDTLDAVDAIVAPGQNLNPADSGWTPRALDRSQRRRPR